MPIILTEQTETRLREKAEREGQDMNAIAGALLASALDWDAREREDAAEGIRHGLADFAAGRYSPASQIFTDIRARHGIPD